MPNLEDLPEIADSKPAVPVTAELIRNSRDNCRALRQAFTAEHDPLQRIWLAEVLAGLEETHRAFCQTQAEELRRVHFERFYGPLILRPHAVRVGAAS